MLKLEQISKSYGTHRVLNDVSFNVLPGRLTGFVGGNGAGKTTTMRITLGLLAKDSGQVLLDGAAVTSDDRKRFGYMPEERGLYPKMKVLEQIAYFARLHGFSKREANDRAADLLTQLGLAERFDSAIETLSLGNQQRAQIAAALVHDPDLLILDEPFSGLDPMAVDVVADVLQRRAAAGNGVLFSSHQLDVVERLCDELVIIADGEVRASGEREQLREAHAGNRYELNTSGDVAWLREFDGVSVVDFERGNAVFDAAPEVSQAVLREAVQRGGVTQFQQIKPRLAEIFKEIVR